MDHTDDFLASFAVAVSTLPSPFARTSKYNAQFSGIANFCGQHAYTKMKSNWLLLLWKHIWREIDKKKTSICFKAEKPPSDLHVMVMIYYTMFFLFRVWWPSPLWYPCSSPPIFLYKTRKCFFCLLSSHKCASRWHLLFLLLIKCLVSSIFTQMVPIPGKGQKWSQSWIKDSCS